MPELEAYMDALRKSGNSVGARVDVVAEGVPPGWGEPIYGKLDGELAAALMSINAVKVWRSALVSAALYKKEPSTVI